jgi:phosphatidate cytidylyltransferase
MNLITFCYIFFVFCNFSYEIHKFESPTFFLYLICICFFTDIGGYVFGKTIGGAKLTQISPNKTISGTIGSFIFSIIPLILFYNLGYLDLEINFNNILFSLAVSLISQLGDLFISYLKRKAKIKDTGKILPGHGGVLDRLDGIIFAVPFSYFLLKLI